MIDVVGQPIDTYMGYGNTETVLYLGGMSFPKTYINSLAESIKSEQEKAEKAMEDEDIPMDEGINFLVKKKPVIEKPKKEMSMRDRIMASVNKNK